MSVSSRKAQIGCTGNVELTNTKSIHHDTDAFFGSIIWPWSLTKLPLLDECKSTLPVVGFSTRT